jgi:hypothetical protein
MNTGQAQESAGIATSHSLVTSSAFLFWLQRGCGCASGKALDGFEERKFLNRVRFIFFPALLAHSGNIALLLCCIFATG